MRFGRLEVVELHGTNKHNFAVWLCKCDCGGITSVVGGNLTSANTISCGCVNKESIGSVNRTHGKTRTKIYRIWMGMKHRCLLENDINYPNYGGRGIKICDKWMSFENFLEDMGKAYKQELTLDRINVDGDYCKENCKWSTNKEQANNKRNSRKVIIDGKEDTITNFCRIYGISDRTVFSRIYTGWDEIRAITTPIYQR